MRDWLFYLLLYFLASGWAVYACLVFLFVPAVAALRASLHPERRARIWWSHAAIAVVLFAAFPLFVNLFQRVEAVFTRRHEARADAMRAEWLRSLPPLLPGRVAPALDAAFAQMPHDDYRARNEIVARMMDSLAAPDRTWTDSDMAAFATVTARLDENARAPGLVVHGPPPYNPVPAIAAWHRDRADLAGAAALCAQQSSDTEQRWCRIALRDVVCGWCARNAAQCAEFGKGPEFAAAAAQIDLRPQCPAPGWRR